MAEIPVRVLVRTGKDLKSVMSTGNGLVMKLTSFEYFLFFMFTGKKLVMRLNHACAFIGLTSLTSIVVGLSGINAEFWRVNQ